MRNFLLGAIALTILGLTIILSETGCQKTAAQLNRPASPNLMLYSKANVNSIQKDSAGNVTATSYWGYDFFVSNIDGSNARKIPIVLPSGLYAFNPAYLTPDGSTIVFTVGGLPVPSQSLSTFIYSCSIEGTNLKKILEDYRLNGVY